jgi:hypothetical protein
MLVGLVAFMGLWLVAALLTSQPAVATIARGVAVAATWVGVTTGLGATLLSRAGTGRTRGKSARPADALSWQTPTPISGVAAARSTASAPRDLR